MASKETFTQHLAHEMAQVVVHRERYGWPPAPIENHFSRPAAV